MTAYILVIWTIVAGGGNQFAAKFEYGWRPMGEFHSKATCDAAGQQIGPQYRCLQK